MAPRRRRGRPQQPRRDRGARAGPAVLAALDHARSTCPRWPTAPAPRGWCSPRTATSSTTSRSPSWPGRPGWTPSRARRRRCWATWSRCGSSAGRAGGRDRRAGGADRGRAGDAATVLARRRAAGAGAAGGRARRWTAAGSPGGTRGRPRLDLLVPRGALAGWPSGSPPPGPAPVGTWAYEALRVRPASRGSASRPTTARSRTRSAGSAPAVHLDKGCYRGQETVARVHNLGRPPRRLVLLHLDGERDELPAPGTRCCSTAGRSASSAPRVHHHELGPVALGVVKRTVAPRRRC